MTAATQQPAAPCLDAILAARGVVAIPGLLHWLGYSERPDNEPEETYEALCERLSKGGA